MKPKKIALDFGHSSLVPAGRDVGASGILKEDTCIKQVHDFLVPELMRYGVDLIICSPTRPASVADSLRQRVNIANRSGADLLVSLHKNAFSSKKAKGSEVFTSGKNSKANPIASRILGNTCDLGYFNRGLKWGNFYVIRHTRMPAILVESFFVTSPEDCDRFNPKLLANAIASGIVGNSVQEYPLVTFEKGILVVKVQTLLKPSAEQSVEIEKDLMQVITPGEYPCELVGEEEGHYLVKFENGKEWFVFGGHADFIDDD